MAVVLTYVGGAELGWLMAGGFPFTAAGFALVYGVARWRAQHEIADFVGYPMQATALKIPGLLIVVVLAIAYGLESLSILVVIALGALLVTVSVLVVRHGYAGSASRLSGHVQRGLPRIVNELCLFLAAGVLAAGISALMTHGVFDNPFQRFDGGTAATVLGIIVLCAFCGIHPIIMISSFSPMLMSLNPDPNLLAVTYLLGWHLGTCSNPLSGTNLVFQGRYGIPAWRLALWNSPYSLVMLVVGGLWLQVVASVLKNIT